VGAVADVNDGDAAQAKVDAVEDSVDVRPIAVVKESEGGVVGCRRAALGQVDEALDRVLKAGEPPGRGGSFNGVDEFVDSFRGRVPCAR
jgi:hypothetical protein